MITKTDMGWRCPTLEDLLQALQELKTTHGWDLESIEWWGWDDGSIVLKNAPTTTTFYIEPWET